MHRQYNNLPQIKSIWIDEDEEAEKLYGLHAQQIMDSDGEEQLEVITLNSEKPILENKRNIELPPLPPSAYEVRKTKSSMNLMRRKVKWSKIFRSKGPRESARPESMQLSISVPYGFQHISHANGRGMFGPEDDDEELEKTSGRSIKSERHFSRAFVTDALPNSSAIDAGQTQRTSTMSTNSGLSSVRVSRSSTSMSTTRVLSTATMATSVLLDVPPAHSSEKKHTATQNEASIEYIKHYRCPVVPEETSPDRTPPLEGSSHSMVEWPPSLHLPQQIDPKQSPAVTSLRRSSSLLTPIVPVRSAFEETETPKGRRSLDEILRFYQQSESESLLSPPSSAQYRSSPRPLPNSANESFY
ncbi:HBR329Cp [Eremothecium sinecaudum]|uniref:HBR329Cp n=1 Tax=Eremothecium sinecaudum TaxID=45286 RepID=A0A120K1C3_9SACH|nr:HBR329Cp [Eremothecium sinecaudum]AMD19230.1 HBR329Cp [Eremothecium sinecaudum]